MILPQIAIEGGDLTGKSTFRQELFKTYETYIGRKLFVIDRSILTTYIYNKWKGDFKELSDLYFKDVIDHITNGGMILLTLSDDEITRRFTGRGDHLYNLSQILDVNRLYNVEAERLGNIPSVKVLKADGQCVADSIKSVSTWCKHMTDITLESKLWNLSCIVENLGDKVGNTKEITNVRLQSLEDCGLGASQDYLDLMDHYKKHISGLKHAEYDMAINKYELFYEALKHKMLYIATKEQTMYGQDPNTTRRFHFTNDQGGCINTLGFNIRGEDCYVTLGFRSADMCILPFDIRGALDAIQFVIASLKLQPSRFILTINIESAHIIDH